MNPAELDALLRQFLVDHKLSGSEQQALMAWVDANISTEHDRSVARSRVFEAARQAIGDPTAREILGFVENALKAVVPAIGAADANEQSSSYFTPGSACLGAIVNRLNAAKESVDICVFTITDNRISDVILAAHRRRVNVRIITDNEKAFDEGSDIQKFRDAGIAVLVDESPFHMHHKFAIFDGRRLINGSYNWTRGAAEQNVENIVDTGEPVLVERFRKEFDAFWKTLSGT